MRLPAEITTVLFDMDGVLINTADAVHNAYTGWAQANGLDPADVLAIVHGRRTVEVATEFGFGEGAETEAERIEQAIADRARPEHGIGPSCELFRSLNRARVAVVTSARRETALTNLRVLGLDRPQVLVTGQDVEAGKPSPDPYLLAAGRIGVEAARCVVIEDAPAGIEAARAAGTHVIALTTTHRADDLGAADEVIAPAQLRELFADLIVS